MKGLDLVAVVLGLVALCSAAQSQTYRSVQLDSAGQLSITLRSGTVLSPAKLRDQVSFSQPRISGDARTVAWLANYDDPSGSQDSSDGLAGRLVLYRAGRVLRSFRTDEIFWSWHFVHQDREVAFCTGPTHGGASECELHGVDSGRLKAKWRTHSQGDRPSWVHGLEY